MASDIERLFALQQVDTRLHVLKREIGELAGSAAESRALIEEKRPIVLARRHEMSELERRRREIEMRLAEDEEKTKDRRMRMQRIRNEKELGALRREVDMMKEQDALLEDELLKILETGDARVGELKALEEELGVHEKAFEERERLHQERAAALKDEMERLRAEREEAARGLDESLRKRYELILDRKNGLAVVAILDGDCGGCRMRVPPQLVTQVHRNEVVFCPACHRILSRPPSA